MVPEVVIALSKNLLGPLFEVRIWRVLVELERKCHEKCRINELTSLELKYLEIQERKRERKGQVEYFKLREQKRELKQQQGGFGDRIGIFR
jgi:hypothetical protein